MKRSVEGKRVVVAGMGVSGVAASLLLKRMGAEVTAGDVRTDADIEEGFRSLRREGIDCRIGRQGTEFLEGKELLVLSPGIGPDSEIVRAARGMGVEIVGEMELASWFWPGRVVAVTGTNGKTTTACMLKAVLDGAGMSSVLAGNIGYPFSRAVIEHEAADLVIVEVSSFQLEHIKLFRPDVALLLNLAPDHLDRYADVAEYYAVKLRVFSCQGAGDRAVFRWDERGAVLPLVEETGARQMTFGLGGGRLTADGDDVMLDGERFISLAGLALPGAHNVENALAAAAGALACGVERGSIGKPIRSFRGLPHRLEFIGKYRGVSYYNDSKATNLDAMLKALSSFTAPVLLIAGGEDKGEDYASVGEALGRRVRAAFLLGESRDAMGAAISARCEVVPCRDLEEAAASAAAAAVEGDIVLLSPGCSSLDMYRSFEARGDHFREIILNLRGGDDE